MAAAPWAAAAFPHFAFNNGSSTMKLGIVTYNVAKNWDLDTILTVCRQVGIDGVEFRTSHRHGVEPSLSKQQRAEVRAKCRDAGLRQISLGSVCEFQSPDPHVVEQNIATCRSFVELARDIGARGVKVRPNGAPKDVPLEKTLRQIGEALRTCGGIAADHGVEIWLEVHGPVTSLCPNVRKIMEYCNHPSVGVTWNSNPSDVVGGSVRPSVELLRPYIRCCHINDLWGDYPYRELFAILRQTGYEGYTLCEVGITIAPEDGVPFLRCYQGLWRELTRI
ncbi:MAG: sugar phosphate isomerase/epimerase family protein [Chthonomonadales bacterium]